MKNVFLAFAVTALFSGTLRAADVVIVPGTSTLIAAVVQRPGHVMVVMNTRNHWARTGTLSPGYEENEQMEIDIVSAITKLCPVARSVFLACGGTRAVAEVIDSLFRQGVENDAEFQYIVETVINHK